MKHSISIVTRTQDNGDGGYTTYGYNSEEELLADHPLSREFKEVDGKWQDVKVKLTQKQKNEILGEDDPHENGYIGSETIEIEIVDGVARLSKPIHIHAGQ